MSGVPHIISLGAGVQSSTMALMAKHGQIIPMPAFAVFADTGDEPSAVYEWLGKLSTMLPFPVYRVQRSRLSEHILEWGHSQIPCFVAGANGKAVIGKRQCTKHWKVIPVQQEIRRRTETQRKRLANGAMIVWQGISWDELTRMAKSRDAWVEHRWPLIEKRMTRRHCLQWMETNGYEEPPKSACSYCPYKNRARWHESKERGGADWQLCIDVSRQLEARGEFLTPDLRPIDQIDFTRPMDNHPEFSFDDECEGMCDV